MSRSCPSTARKCARRLKPSTASAKASIRPASTWPTAPPTRWQDRWTRRCCQGNDFTQTDLAGAGRVLIKPGRAGHLTIPRDAPPSLRDGAGRHIHPSLRAERSNPGAAGGHLREGRAAAPGLLRLRLARTVRGGTPGRDRVFLPVGGRLVRVRQHHASYSPEISPSGGLVVRDGPAGLLTMRGLGLGIGVNGLAATHRDAKCACPIARGVCPPPANHIRTCLYVHCPDIPRLLEGAEPHGAAHT